MNQRFLTGRISLLIFAAVLMVTVACGSESGNDAPKLTPAEIALATARAETNDLAPTGAGNLSAADVLQRAGEISATLESFRFTTETVVTGGEDIQISTISGEWSQPGRYRAASNSPDDPIAEFIVADGQLLYRERESNEWRLETEFDQSLGIGSGQLIPAMDIFEFTDPDVPDDGEFYRITGAENLDLEGIDKPIVQTHELVIRVADFHIESVVSFINRDPEIGLEGTRRAFVVSDRNVPERIVIPEIAPPPGG